MLIEFKFTSLDGQEIEGLRTKFDRDYPDEETAIVLIANDESDTGGYFELNIRKDETGHFTGGGYVAEYDSEDDSEPSYISDNITLEVTEHGFDETLHEANEKLMPFGKRIVVDYDGEGYWSVGSTDMDGSNPDCYVDGDFEHEVQGSIYECLAHVLARVKNPELVKPEKQDSPKVYTQKEMENAVMLAADLYQQLYSADSPCDGALEIAQVIIFEAQDMEKWITEKYGPDDEEYLDRLEEYEAMLVKKYDLK